MFFVCFFVRSTISQHPRADSRQILHAGVAWVSRRVFSSFGGWRPPAGGKRGKWNFRYYGSQWGIFAFWRFLSDISATLARIYTKYYLCMSVRLSDTRHNKVETAKHIIKLYSPSHSHTYHSRFSIPNGMAIFRLELLTGDVEYRGWCENRDFRPTYRFI